MPPWLKTTSLHRRDDESPSLQRSRSLDDLARPEVQVRNVAKQFEREAKVYVSERDKKIAALMLLKHKEEEMIKKRRWKAEQAWEDVKCKERSLKEVLNQYEKQSYETKSLGRMQPWRSKGDRELDEILNMSMCSNGWRTKLTTEERLRLKQGLVRVRHAAMHDQEAAEKASRENDALREDKLIQAIKTKMMRDSQQKNHIRQKNQYQMMQHCQQKQVVDNQAKAEVLFKKMSIQQKEQRAQEIHELIVEERCQDLKEKAAREDEQIMLAKIRVEQQHREQMRHKKMLVQQTNQKMQQAVESQKKNIQSKAEKARAQNMIKERTHHSLKQKVEQEEENHRKVIEHLIKIKDKKSDKLLREKEATVEEGKRTARASFHLRDKIRERTKSRTFDQMALNAQLQNSLIKLT
ncbi:coiled-coil domain-containing protein 185 [Pelodytes ibericus]